MNQNTKSVIITGAQGFIGSHTAKAFKEAGWYVIGVDWNNTIPNSVKYIDELISCDFVDCARLFPNIFRASAIVHCAGTSLVGPSIENPAVYYDNNCAKTNQLMLQLKELEWHGVIVFSSSAAVYGIPEDPSNIVETADKAPINPYGKSKLFCESIISDACSAYNFRGIALRYFNACGCDPNGTLGHVKDDTHMIPRVLSAYQANQPFILYGHDYDTPDGTCIRDYLHVSDIAAAHLEAVALAKKLKPAQFDCYNLGTGIGYSNREIISAAEQVVNNYINVHAGSRRVGDPAVLVANSAAFQSATSWRPMYSDINTIIATAWNWQQQI